MRGYVGVTDGDWYRFLASRPALAEVNFWQPSGSRTFSVLQHGDPFLFKTHHPHNRVVGGGFFSGFARLKLSEAWEFFGPANGVASVEEMRRRVGKYRSVPIALNDDPVIGCIFIRDVSFLSPGQEIDAPPAFAANVVQGKSYDLDEEPGFSYFEEALRRLLSSESPQAVDQTWSRPGPVYSDPHLTRGRLGQQSFQAVVLDAYHRRCAVTGERIRPVLQAAHIKPLPRGGEHRLDNGLLLRSDVHTLFDRGYLGVDPKFRLVVSPRLREEFENGEEFYARSGEQIALPDKRIDRPNSEYLEWHLEEVFLPSRAS
jgi:putative restriction endonuclease